MSFLDPIRKLPPDKLRVNIRADNIEDLFDTMPEELNGILNEERTKLKIEFYQSCAELLNVLWSDYYSSLPQQFEPPQSCDQNTELSDRFEASIAAARSWFYDIDTRLILEQLRKHPELAERVEELRRYGAGEVPVLIGGVIEAGISGGFQTIEHSFSDPVNQFLRRNDYELKLSGSDIDALIKELRQVSGVAAFLAMKHFQRSWDLQGGRRGNHVPWLNLSRPAGNWHLSIDEQLLRNYDSTNQLKLKTPTLGCPFAAVPKGLAEFTSWVFNTAIIPCLRTLET